ncbi:helix-turn-helix domain-containing protein [Leptospira kmetyi]|uniref:helix-turn-helix domain-containing protein n=1 Tax=Leptospira kmetyi TaxID=408139 RepID=UPI00028A3CA2|nr:helix-turn-helix domain-containing protein [Leptospira kmetyi]EQA51947.1 DNA-binding helix-turn-helix protein [Leptospira kmetyi serovar Malaysia str. Bejo-Iso9]
MIYVEWFANAFAVFGGFLAFLLSVSEWITFKKTKFQIYFSAALLLIGILQILNAISFQGVFQNTVLYVRFSLPVLFLIGPVAYVALRAMVEEEFQWNTKSILSFVPAALCGLVLFVVPRETLILPWERNPDLPFENVNWIFWIYGFAGVYSFLFGVLIFRILSAVSEMKLRILIWICFMDFTTVSAFGLLGLYYGIFFLKISAVVVSIALCGIYYVRKEYSNLEETIHVELVKAKYSRSRLGGLEVDSILARLETMMETERMYQNEEVSLGYVAERVSLTTHQLSELINRKLNKSFFVWLNQYRVEEAKKLLKETDKTVLEIAMEVGFNNRSSFNEAFLKLTEKTPIDFRKTAKV